MAKIVPLTDKQKRELDYLNKVFGSVVSRSQLMEHFSKKNDNGILPRWVMADPMYKAGRGVYHTTIQNGGTSTTKLDPTKPFPKFKTKVKASIPSQPTKQEVNIVDVPLPEAETVSATAQVIPMHPVSKPEAPKIQVGDTDGNSGALIPEVDETFVPFGVYDQVLKVIRKGVFYPLYITGLTGNGKTMLVQQACAIAKRELVRVQITPETDEDDLIGGFRLINGETVWFDGPVVLAARRGAICLIDEVDYGTGKISCLQGILEGNGIFLKKVNRIVPIAPGFNIIATANTKGRGSEEFGGKYINTQIMNEAFLERFGATFEQEYPPVKTEIKILQKTLASFGTDNDLYAENLVNWADVTRKAYYNSGSDDLITTRRLVHIIKAYVIYGDEKEAIKMCLSRFDRDTAEGFMQLYDKVAKENVPVVADPISVETAITANEALNHSNLVVKNTARAVMQQAFDDAATSIDPSIDPDQALTNNPEIMGKFVSLMKDRGYFIKW